MTASTTVNGLPVAKTIPSWTAMRNEYPITEGAKVVSTAPVAGSTAIRLLRLPAAKSPEA